MHLLINFLLCFHSSESKSSFRNSVTNIVEGFEAVHLQISTTKKEAVTSKIPEPPRGKWQCQHLPVR